MGPPGIRNRSSRSWCCRRSYRERVRRWKIRQGQARSGAGCIVQLVLLLLSYRKGVTDTVKGRLINARPGFWLTALGPNAFNKELVWHFSVKTRQQKLNSYVASPIVISWAGS